MFVRVSPMFIDENSSNLYLCLMALVSSS